MKFFFFGSRNIVFVHGSGQSLDTISLLRKVKKCGFHEAIYLIPGNNGHLYKEDRPNRVNLQGRKSQYLGDYKWSFEEATRPLRDGRESLLQSQEVKYLFLSYGIKRETLERLPIALNKDTQGRESILYYASLEDPTFTKTKTLNRNDKGKGDSLICYGNKPLLWFPSGESTESGKVLFLCGGEEIAILMEMHDIQDMVREYDKNNSFSGYKKICDISSNSRIEIAGRIYDIDIISESNSVTILSTPFVLNTVTKGFERNVDEVMDLTIISENNEETTITGTPEHPFFVPSMNQYIPMRNLTNGLLLQDDINRNVTVGRIQHMKGEFSVFNFEVEKGHNYFVSDKYIHCNVLVHNNCFNPDQQALIDLAQEYRHGVGPRENARTLIDWANEYGIRAVDDINATHWAPNGVPIPHIRIGPVNHIPVE